MFGLVLGEMGKITDKVLQTLQDLFCRPPRTGLDDPPGLVLLTLKDGLVSKRAQEAMAQRLPAAKRFPLTEGHLACTSQAFPDRLLEACLDVKRRVEQAQADG